MKVWGICAAFLVALQACGGGGTAAPSTAATAPASATAPAYWTPAASDRFQWQFTGLPLDAHIAASVYDIDAFDTSSATVSALHAAARHVVCYVDAGTFEDWRPDVAQYRAHPDIVGNAVSGWPGEYWLDIRRLDVLGPLIDARLDICKSKGFDAVESDNVDGYANATGFALTAADQLAFNSWLAQHVHARGMSAALKNDPDQIPQLLSSFDWGIEEECNAQNWCAKAAPFLSAGKAVVEIEYTDQVTPATFTSFYCPAAQQSGAHALLKHRGLDSYVAICS